MRHFAFGLILLSFTSCIQNSAPTTATKKYAAPEIRETEQAFSGSTVARWNYFWNQLHRRAHYTGVTLLAWNDSIYTWTAGEADSAVALTADMPMQIASISKTFCATSVMLLVSKGKLKLSDTLQHFYPKLDFYEPITIEQLLSHSTGLPEYTWFCEKTWRDSNAQITNKEVIELMETEKPEAYYKPGKRHRYTNTNFIILASIVEKISGQTYPVFLEKNIFKPLNMLHTRVLLPTENSDSLEVLGHYGNGKVYGKHYQDGTFGDKNIISSVRDLYRFYLGLKENKILPEIYKKEMFATRWPNARRGTAYALGWRKRNEFGETWMFHAGWWHGFRTNFYFNEKTNQCAVTLSNRLSGGFIPGKTIISMFHQEVWQKITRAWDFNDGVDTASAE